MPILECRVDVPASIAAAFDEIVGNLGDLRWTLHEDLPGRRTVLTGFFPGKAAAREGWDRLRRDLEGRGFKAATPAMRVLPETDWAESYRLHFKAWRIRNRFWVPEWERGKFRAPPRASVVWLDPGLAFGTGDHESTRLCCERLVEFADRFGPGGPGRARNADEPPLSVLDVGCGSGILAISAARFGFRPVAGFDNDRLAVRVSRENAQLNGLAGQIDFFPGELKSGLKGRTAGLVLANILTNVLRDHARHLVGAVAPGGWLSLSGILAREVRALKDDFRRIAPGWTARSRRMGEWADLLLTRPS